MQVKPLSAGSVPGSCGIAAGEEGEVGQDSMGQAGWDGASRMGWGRQDGMGQPALESRTQRPALTPGMRVEFPNFHTGEGTLILLPQQSHRQHVACPGPQTQAGICGFVKTFHV